MSFQNHNFRIQIKILFMKPERFLPLKVHVTKTLMIQEVYKNIVNMIHMNQCALISCLYVNKNQN